MINVKFKQQCEINKISEIESGTVVRYGHCGEIYGLGILIKDVDGECPLIFDLEDMVYYDDLSNYEIYNTYDYATLTID